MLALIVPMHIMRTNVDIDDDLMADAMQAGRCTTKKDAVEAGLQLLVRQAAYREILKWRGKLKWEGDAAADWAAGAPPTETAEAPRGPLEIAEPARRGGRIPGGGPGGAASGKRRAGR